MRTFVTICVIGYDISPRWPGILWQGDHTHQPTILKEQSLQNNNFDTPPD